MDEVYRKAFKYIVEQKAGYYTDLRKNLPEEVISQFESVGFIKNGYNLKGKTWGITELGKLYYYDIYC